MDWSQVTALTIPEGSVKQVSVNGVVLWKKGSPLSDYTQLEYIESTGTQYLIIPYIVNNNTSIFCRYLQTALGDEVASVIFGVTSQPDVSIANYGCLKLVNGTAKFNRVGWGSNTNHSIIDINGYNNLNQWYDVFYDLNKLYIDNTLVATSSTPTSEVWQAQYNLGLFARNGTSVSMKAKARIASSWAKENGRYVLNLIPVMRNSDSKVGMYDTVTRQFFTNAGTGEFIASPRFVEYIEFDGNSWIDTGFTQQTCRIEFGVEFINHNNNAVQLMGFHVSDAGFWGIKFRGGMFYPCLNVNPYQYNDVILNFDTTDTKKPALTLTIGNTTSSPVVGSTVSTNTTYVMGGLKYGSNINYNNFMKAHYNRIYNANNELIQDLRPCLDGNNVACMYDMVTGTYFYNQGTGQFIAGGIL